MSPSSKVEMSHTWPRRAQRHGHGDSCSDDHNDHARNRSAQNGSSGGRPDAPDRPGRAAAWHEPAADRAARGSLRGRRMDKLHPSPFQGCGVNRGRHPTAGFGQFRRPMSARFGPEVPRQYRDQTITRESKLIDVGCRPAVPMSAPFAAPVNRSVDAELARCWNHPPRSINLSSRLCACPRASAGTPLRRKRAARSALPARR